VERHGPKRVLQGTLLLAVATLATAGISGSAALVWVLGPAIGITLGAVWTSDRVLMMRITPPDARGEFFSVYNLVGKLSNGIGPLVLWSGTIWLLHEHGTWTALAASRLALVLLAGAVVAGMLVLRPLSDAERFPTHEDLDLREDAPA
jgi:MFS-type transporter involved in bile tolerance (Atg22 family)